MIPHEAHEHLYEKRHDNGQDYSKKRVEDNENLDN